MSHDIAARFDAEYAPRIAQAIARLFGQRIHVELVQDESPARIRIYGEPFDEARRFRHPLNVYLSWDGLEVEALFAAGGEVKFAHYLAALPGKMRAWQVPRQIDFGTRSQADPMVLLGGLDFEH
ncbi:DUF5594 family protein [Cupriavidus sp. 2TAF22]|uniref:DUF5594 family protein n=1 Tax=unclassified Cupriavidus TaxID=2640874 RepID=UPI003F8E52A4